MRKCTKCLEDFPEEEFRWKNKATNLRHKNCKGCLKAAGDNWRRTPNGLEKRRVSNRAGAKDKRRRNAQYVWNYLLEHPCIDCGEANPIVLDFDHRNGSEKIHAVSKMTRGTFSIEKLQQEIDKCDVRCANCHRKRTAVQFNWYASINTNGDL